MHARVSTHICPRYQLAVELLGKRWTGLILQLLLHGPLRFSELGEQLEVVSERVLSARLKELEAEGVIARRVDPGPPVKVSYALTPKGRAMGAVVEALTKWADKWVEPASPGKARRTAVRKSRRL